MAFRQVKRSASSRVLASEAAASDSSSGNAGRAASPLPCRVTPSMPRNKSMPAVGGGVPAVPRRVKTGLENVPPADSPKSRKQTRDGSPEIGKYKNASVLDSPETPDRDLSRPLVETSSNRPSPGKRKLEFAKPSESETPASATSDQNNIGGDNDKGVRVIIRVRPLSKAEQLSESEPGLLIDSDCSIVADGQQYTFDTVAGERTTQAGMFKIAGRSAVENCLAGFNSSIFAYGQTGSGKTHTMTGQMDGSEARGLTSRVFEHMFLRMKEEEKAHADKQLKYICKCSFLEIYNEQITDLLEPSSKNLQVREDKKNGIYVEGLLEDVIEGVDDMQKLILKGTSNRTVAATNMNSASSRSHSVFTCTILSRNKNVTDGTVNVRRSRLNLVDLAGSERQKLTGAQGDRLKEASKINSSLSALGNVIKVLAEVAQTGKQRHVPYRDSRLTYLLQESLGGNAKTVMIANVSPSSSCLGETVSTLKFAQRAKAVQNKAVVNEETTNDVNVLKQQIRRLKDELLRMKAATPARSPSPASPETAPTTPAEQAASPSSPSEAVSPEVLELTAKITELSQEALFVASFQGKLLDLDNSPVHSPVNSSPYNPVQSPVLSSAHNPVHSPQHSPLHSPVHSPVRNITTRRRKQWADVARDVREADEPPMQTVSPPKGKSRLFSACPDGFEVLADSPGRARRHGADADSDVDSSEDEHSDKENSSCFQTTPGSEEAQLTYLQKLRISKESDLPQCVASPDSPNFGRDRRSKLRAPSQEKNLLLTPPFTPAQSLDVPQRGTGEELRPPTASEVERNLRAAADHLKDDVGGLDVVSRSYRASEETFFSSNDDADEGMASPEGGAKGGGSRQSVESVKAPVEASPEKDSDLLSGSTGDAPEIEEPPTPFTPGFGKQQRWSSKQARKAQAELDNLPDSPSEVQLLDANPSVEPGQVSAAESLVSPLSPKPAQRTVTFSNEDASTGCGDFEAGDPLKAPNTGTDCANALKAPETGTGFGGFEAGDPAGLQMVLRVDRSVQGPSESSFAGSIASLLGSDVAGLSDGQLRAVEGVLTGALRREQVAEEHSQQLEGELEAMKRIVREYEHDYECNKKLVDCREDKIARLEQLADGVMSESDFMAQERLAAQLERRAMQEKIDRHPEVTRFAMENMRLVEQLRRYEDFYGCGEREALQKELQQLRDHLIHALEAGPGLRTGPSTSPARAIQSGPSKELDGPPGVSDPLVASLEADVAYYKELAEVQQREADEAKHTLGGAIVSNAKMAGFFEEIQKENDRLLHKHRAIREATAGMVSAAVSKHGVDPESKWLQAHAAELAALRADEKENLREIDALQGQLRDAREAVRAAGELTTRLQRAEERAQACDEVSARAEQTVKELRRKADHMRRQHAAEIAAAERRVWEARSKKGTVCQMCHMSERVVFHLPEGGEEPKPSQTILHRSQTEPNRVTLSKSTKKGFWFWGKGKTKEDTLVETGSEEPELLLARKESISSNRSRVAEKEGGGKMGEELAPFESSLESLPLTPR